MFKNEMIESYGYPDYEKYDCYDDGIMDEFYGCCIDNNDYYMTKKIGKIDPDTDELIFDYLRPHHTIFKYMLYMNLCL